MYATWIYSAWTGRQICVPSRCIVPRLLATVHRHPWLNFEERTHQTWRRPKWQATCRPALRNYLCECIHPWCLAWSAELSCKVATAIDWGSIATLEWLHRQHRFGSQGYLCQMTARRLLIGSLQFRTNLEKLPHAFRPVGLTDFLTATRNIPSELFPYSKCWLGSFEQTADRVGKQHLQNSVKDTKQTNYQRTGWNSWSARGEEQQDRLACNSRYFQFYCEACSSRLKWHQSNLKWL